MTADPHRPRPPNRLPDWDVADLPEPHPLKWRHWTRFIGPGIVMMGIQIGGGEWLLGPEVTAKYGGGLMWIATIAIVLQVFYNLECGRYALYCGEPIFTGFLANEAGTPILDGSHPLSQPELLDSGPLDARGGHGGVALARPASG